MAASALAALLAVLSIAPAGPVRASGEAQLLSGTLTREASEAALPLFAVAGETWELGLHGLGDRGQLVVVDPRSGGVVAPIEQQPSNGLRWTASATGVWRIRVRSQAPGLHEAFAVGPFTVQARRLGDTGGSAAAPAPMQIRNDGIALAQGRIDWSGDDDWFAVGVAGGGRYVVYTMLGSLGATRGDVLLPGEDAPIPLRLHENGVTLYHEARPRAEGTALIRIAGAEGGYGSFALGVSVLAGDGQLSAVSAATDEVEQAEHRLRGALMRSGPGELAIDLHADWASFEGGRRAGVWVDVDADGRWDQVAQTLDGRSARVWSIVERRWLPGETAVGSSGFDSLVLRFSTRGFDSEVRWRAAVRGADGRWTGGAAGRVRTQPPEPQRPTLWAITQGSGTAEQREAALRAAGVGEQGAGQPVVALDPGHGGEETGPIIGGLIESRSNMALARQVAARLEAAGVHAALTRDGDTLARLNFSGEKGRADLHARPDLAHAAGADLFISLHSNAAHNDWQQGLEAWYYPSPTGDGSNRAFAGWMLEAVAGSLAEWGYRPPAAVFDSSCWEIVEDYCDPLYVLAPFLLLDYQAGIDWGLDPGVMGLSDDPWDAPRRLRQPTGQPQTKGVGPIDLVDAERQTGPSSVIRGTMMPTVLLELLYMTHERDASALRSADGRAALARGVAEGILSWLRREGRLASE